MFPYTGPVDELSIVLERTRPHLEKAYRHVLGGYFFEKLQKAEVELLCDESFLELEFAINYGLGYHVTANNKFVTACRFDDDEFEGKPDGSFKLSHLEAAPGFIFSHEGFELTRKNYKGWVNPYLAPYIHEYDHFVYYVLQEKPMLVAETLLSKLLPDMKTFPHVEEIDSFVANLNVPFGEKQRMAFIALWMWMIHRNYELSTRKLDIAIMRQMGVRIPDDYDPKYKKEIVPLMLDSIRTGIFFPTGDVLWDTSIKKRVEIFSEWEKNLEPTNEVQVNFMNSFKRMNFKKIPLGNLSKKEISGIDHEGAA